MAAPARYLPGAGRPGGPSVRLAVIWACLILGTFGGLVAVILASGMAGGLLAW